MWNERRESLLKRVKQLCNQEQLRDWESSQGDKGYGDVCGHYGGNYWMRNTQTGETVAVVPDLRPNNSRLGRLLRLEYRLLLKKTHGPEWERM